MFGTTAFAIGATLAVAWPDLTALYAICLIVGGGLLVISTVFGSHHHAETGVGVDVGTDAPADLDFGGDVHADVDTDIQFDTAELHADGVGSHMHHGPLDLASWFSISFVVYFTASFGLVGTVLSFTTGLAQPVVLLLSLVAGLGIGQAVHQLLRYVRRSSGNSLVSARDYLNAPGRVTIALPAGGRGEIAVQVRGRELFVAAVARRADESYPIGERIVVVGFANGTAEVVSKTEHDFLTES